MKNILLKLANRIYNYYNKTIEIQFDDIIKFKDGYFRIVSVAHTKEIGCVDTLKIELHDINECLKYKFK